MRVSIISTQCHLTTNIELQVFGEFPSCRPRRVRHFPASFFHEAEEAGRHRRAMERGHLKVEEGVQSERFRLLSLPPSRIAIADGPLSKWWLSTSSSHAHNSRIYLGERPALFCAPFWPHFSFQPPPPPLFVSSPLPTPNLSGLRSGWWKGRRL